MNLKKLVVHAVAALSCTWAINATAQQVEKSWPPQSAWIVLKVRLPSGREACSLTTRKAPWGPASIAATMITDLHDTQFQFIYAGPEIPPFSQLLLFADKRFITALPVRSQGRLLQAYAIVAGMPGDVLQRRVLPALGDALALSIQTGLRGYVILIGRVATLRRELSACTEELVAQDDRNSGAPSYPHGTSGNGRTDGAQVR